MMCYKDMTFCSAAERCKNRTKCGRWFNASHRTASQKWWEGCKGEPPVAFSDFSETCELFKEDRDK